MDQEARVSAPSAAPKVTRTEDNDPVISLYEAVLDYLKAPWDDRAGEALNLRGHLATVREGVYKDYGFWLDA